MKITYIYTLSDPITDETRYVGKTINPYFRFKSHICYARKSTKSHKNAWVRKILNLGRTPKFDIIDECERDWENCEKFWISQFKAWGFRLLNETEGGEGALLTKRSKRAKRILQYDSGGNLIEIFPSFIEIKEKYPSFERQGVQECCLGRLKTYRKYKWSYSKN